MTNRATPTFPARASQQRFGTDRYDDLEPLSTRLAALDATDPRRKPLRDEVIKRGRPLAENIARKYIGRGENYEDLMQAAWAGMVIAVDRFDPDCGASFLSFAIPTIMGEVRHHFHDYVCAIHAPRRLEELQLTIGPAIDRLFEWLERMPTAAEIAGELDVDRAEVIQTLIASIVDGAS